MRTIYDISVIDKATEDNLWQSALIVFDTCAYFDFYYMTPEYQKIMSEILLNLSDRIWVPAQVVYEYRKNRGSTLYKPFAEKYGKRDVLSNKLVDTLKASIAQWEKKYYHPYLDDDKLKQVKEVLAVIEPRVAEVKRIIAEEYQKRKKEIDAIAQDDTLYDVFQKLSHGLPFSFSEVKMIAEEGNFRYANHIPPGYEDAKSKDGIRQYGDLIIWKEVIKHAKEERKDVIFVTNDSKRDWLINDESKAEKPSNKELGKPRRELLAEFEEETGQKIWFYKTGDFIAKLEEQYKPREAELPFYGQLGVVRDVLERIQRERDVRRDHSEDSIIVRCGKCGELFAIDDTDLEFNWEGSAIEDRQMGCEYEYTSEENCECPNCGNEIELTLKIWEYPAGVFNGEEIEIDGGEVEKHIELSRYMAFGDYDFCDRCGEWATLNSHGLCDQCEEEFQKFVNSDD